MARAPQTTDAASGERPATRERLKRVRRIPEFEIALGTRICIARLAARMSQAAVGEAVGVSFQQLQKYELGKDRVAASRLQGMAAALGLYPGSFFDDIPASADPVSDGRAALGLAERIQRIRNPVVLRRLLALTGLLAGIEHEQPATASDGTP